MGKLKFYDIHKKYISYLKKFDHQIPEIEYDNNSKFFCGIVLEINGFNYYAPITSFNKQQRTNFVILDKGRPISSIRFSFMVPASEPFITLTDFSSKPQKYKDLVNAEVKYCNQNITAIYKKAKEVYKIGINKKHPLNHTCCDFKLLEEKSLIYNNTMKEIAVSKEDESID